MDVSWQLFHEEFTLCFRPGNLHERDKIFLLDASALLQWSEKVGSSLSGCWYTPVKRGQYCCNEWLCIYSVHLPSSLPLEETSSVSAEFTEAKAIAKGGVPVCKNQIQPARWACQGQLQRASTMWILWPDLPTADGREKHMCLQPGLWPPVKASPVQLVQPWTAINQLGHTGRWSFWQQKSWQCLMWDFWV